MFGLFRKKATTGNFWDWLGTNTRRIQSGLQRDPQGISTEIGREFERAYPDLVWEVGPSDSGPWTFCVSANGNRDLFARVIRTVREAPRVPGWEVQAFRPRGPLTAELQMGGRTLSYDDIWCGVQPLGVGVGVTLCVRGLTPETQSVLSPAVLILLDNAVGEYDAVVKISRLDLQALPRNPVRDDDFFPLAELPPYLDQVKGASSVDL